MSQATSISSLSIQLQGEELQLISDKAIFWPKKRCIMIADLHIGKVSHFRKNNIPIPQAAADKNFEKLEALILEWKPKTLYFLGDLFHSFYNKEWEVLSFLLAKYSKVAFVLITGNHDILNKENYVTAGIKCYDQLALGPFMLTHHPEEHDGYYNLCGHIHPGIRLRGDARQSMRLPCFYFGKNQGILPAFGSFTGTAVLKPSSNDTVYAVANNQIIPLNV